MRGIRETILTLMEKKHNKIYGIQLKHCLKGNVWCSAWIIRKGKYKINNVSFYLKKQGGNDKLNLKQAERKK